LNSEILILIVAYQKSDSSDYAEVFAVCTGYRFGNGWLTSWQLWCTDV